MRPGYQKLLELNPLLRNKTSEETEKLVDMIEKCGYAWDPTREMFYNSEIFRGVRTQGLDLFTPESFKKNHEEIIKERARNPEQYRHKARLIILWRKLATFIIILSIVDILAGWIFLSFKHWLFSFVLLFLVFGFVYLITIGRIKPKKNLKK